MACSESVGNGGDKACGCSAVIVLVCVARFTTGRSSAPCASCKPGIGLPGEAPRSVAEVSPGEALGAAVADTNYENVRGETESWTKATDLYEVFCREPD